MPTLRNERQFVLSTARWQRYYHVSVRAVDFVPQLMEIPRPIRIPYSKIGLIQFATERFGRGFGQRIATLAAARPAYGGHRLRAGSLRFALDFLAAHHDGWRLPDGVFLPATGNVQVLWRSGRVRVVAQFQPDEIVWFSVIEDSQLQLTGRVPPREFAAQHRIQEAIRR